VELVEAGRELRILDELDSSRVHRGTLAFHLGPRVDAMLEGRRAVLSWSHRGRDQSASLELPGELTWTRHCGESAPPLGWYSSGFGRKEPAITLLGKGSIGPNARLLTTIGFRP
jgi:hypothetical protein